MFFVYDESTGSLRDPRDPNPINLNNFHVVTGVPFDLDNDPNDNDGEIVREGRLDYPTAIEARAVEVKASDDSRNSKSNN